MPIADEDLEWAVRLALECRRRVKEQQKRIGSRRVPQHPLQLQIGEDGVEQFVATPELQSEDSIGSDPLPPGQVWAISPGGQDEDAGPLPHRGQRGPGLRRAHPQPPVPPARSARASSYAEQNLSCAPANSSATATRGSTSSPCSCAPSTHQRPAPAWVCRRLLALCSALLGKSLKGGLIAVGGLNLGGAIDPVYNAVNVAELAVEKGASMLLIPISARRQLNDLSDDMATKLTILYYADAREALLKALGD